MTSHNNHDGSHAADITLISQVLNGESKAFTTIMRRYKTPLYRFALRHLGDEDDAEDAVQDAFIAAYNNLHRYKSQYKLSTWLFQITLNKCRDIGRKRKTRAFMQRMTPFIEDTIAGKDNLDNPEMRHQSRSELGQLEDEIASLPEALKSAFILSVLDQKPHKEIAQILKISVKAVELRIYRARQRLRQRLRP